MPIVTADLPYRLSGGTTNVSPAASLGGERSTATGGVIVSGALRALFDDVTGTEAAAGDIEYRCIYIVNAHATLTLSDAVLWIFSPTTSTSTEFDIQLDPAAIGAASAILLTTENETPDTTALPPGGWVRPSTKLTGLTIGSMPALTHKAFWVRRTVTAGAEAASADTGILRVQGESPA